MADAAYHAAWRAKNPEKVKAAQSKYTAANKARRVAWAQANPDKMAESKARYRATDQGRGRHAALQAKRRAIDPQKARAAARRAQGMVDPTGEMRIGPCEICSTPGALHLDHDHETGAVRGWLCGNCNRGLGMLRDSPLLLKSAIHYLELNRP